MGHMQAQMTKKRGWLEVDGPMGTEWVDLEDLGISPEVAKSIVRSHHFAGGTSSLTAFGNIAQFFENTKAWEIKIVKGYGVRSSAPGYLDATPWVVYTSLKDARKAYAEEKRALRGQDW